MPDSVTICADAFKVGGERFGDDGSYIGEVNNRVTLYLNPVHAG